MSQKTIIQRAQGYNASPVTVAVSINNSVIYQGPVPTENQNPPVLPDAWTPELGVNSWSWPVDVEFQGTVDMTVTVNNGKLLLCDTFVNLTQPDPNPAITYPLIYQRAESGLEIKDPLTEVKINNVLQSVPRDSTHVGQWIWLLKAGDTFSCKVNIVPLPANPT